MREHLGSWLLPQPIRTKEYVRVPKLNPYGKIPFGYKIDPDDPDWYVPIPHELDALKLAAKYCARYSLKQVAAWLTKQTGRSISAEGLRRRIKDDRRRKNRRNFYLALAARYKDALEKAKSYEETLGRQERTIFFDEEPYTSLYERYPIPDR